MRCSCCDKNLSNAESVLRHTEHGYFLDTCFRCLDGLDIPTTGRSNFAEPEPVNDEWDQVSESLGFDDHEENEE